mgnify:FL=1
MYIKPPQIQLLTAFESAARVNSFKKAATELSITASAVSQQIKQLEAYLDVQLFNRLTRRVELTEAGVAFQRVAENTLSTYRSGYSAFQQQFSKPTIRLSVIPFVAFELIIPNLHEFRQLHPDIDLRIETSMALIDFDKEPIDAALRFGDGNWNGVEKLIISDCQSALVASRSLLESRPINSLDDLASHTLIHTRSSEDDWQKVANNLGVSKIVGKNYLVMDSYLSAMKAAEEGLGIAIGLFPLNNKWVRMGRLVTVFEPIDISYKNYFVFRRNDRKQKQLACCFQWLKAKYQALEQE